jgi:hypothetical protein
LSILVIEPQYHANNIALPHSLVELGLDLVYLKNNSPLSSIRISGVLVIGDAIRDNDSPLSWHVGDLRVLDMALTKDMPILAVGMGMHVLNELFGGRPSLYVDGHIDYDEEGKGIRTKHSVYVSPGSKSAAILGLGGFFNLNSQHWLGLTDLDRAKSLMASAYSVEDGVVEGLESPQHDWVIGFQSNIELLSENPRAFKNIFLGFNDRSESCEESKILRNLDLAL